MRGTPSDAGRYRGSVVVTAGLALILVGSFLPWLRSGRAWRNSYEVVRTADRLGLVGNGYQSVLAVCWYLVPLLCGLTLTAMVFDRHRLSSLGSTLVAAFVIVMAVVAWRAPLRLGHGPEVAALGAFLAIVGAGQRRVRRTDAPHASKEIGSSVTRAPVRWRRSAR